MRWELHREWISHLLSPPILMCIHTQVECFVLLFGGNVLKTWCYLLQSLGYTGSLEAEVSLPPQQFLKLLLVVTLEPFTLPRNEAQEKWNETGTELGSHSTLVALVNSSSQRDCTWLRFREARACLSHQIRRWHYKFYLLFFCTCWSFPCIGHKLCVIWKSFSEDLGLKQSAFS